MTTNEDPPKSARPMRRDAERNRLRILAATRDLLAARGLEVSHDDIAKAAEVGVGTVYRHFPDKQELFDLLFDERVDEVVALAERATRIDDPWEALYAFIAGNLEIQAGNQALKELMLGAGRTGDLAQRAQRRIGAAVGELVARAKAAGVLRPEIGVEDFPLVQMMVGAVMENARHVDPLLWRRALALVLDGYRAGPHPGPVPGATPTPRQIEQILGNWRPPRR
jgi:AcrR family transcriptional regulator